MTYSKKPNKHIGSVRTDGRTDRLGRSSIAPPSNESIQSETAWNRKQLRCVCVPLASWQVEELHSWFTKKGKGFRLLLQPPNSGRITKEKMPPAHHRLRYGMIIGNLQPWQPSRRVRKNTRKEKWDQQSPTGSLRKKQARAGHSREVCWLGVMLS